MNSGNEIAISNYEVINMFNFIYSFKQGIKNLINWFSIIWSDRDWDHHFFYKILHQKLYNMENFFNSNNACGANSKKDAQNIKVARLLCKRIIDNDYLSNAQVPYDKKYDSNNFMTIEPCKDGSGLSYCKFTEDEKEMKLYRRCSDHSDYMEKQDKDYLFKWIKKYIDGWWN